MAFTPSRFVSKQSHSSPVIVTASSSASGNRPTSPARAAGSRSGCFQRANGTDTARLSGVAAFRFAPPTSSPKIVGGIVPRKIQGPPMPRYLVGIDLGTTNSALAYVDTASKPAAGGPKLHTFNAPQVVAAGQVGEQPLLPSFLYLPGPHDLAPGSIDLPWKKNPPDAVGVFARNHGARVPGRLVSSAKSWLCHPGVDRTAPLLPWAGPPDVPRLSPLEVSARYLRRFVEAWNDAPNRTPEDRREDQEVVITVPASFDDVARNLTADAAKQAGLKHVTLLEEPQAAFYAWLGTHDPKEAGKLKPGMRCLVVDVGGGTSDFSLIRAGEEHGELSFVRDAVGDHLLLGGDNMDLALAKTVEAKLPSAGKLDAAQYGTLVQACRSAKEALLTPGGPASFPVTLMGRGR